MQQIAMWIAGGWAFVIGMGLTIFGALGVLAFPKLPVLLRLWRLSIAIGMILVIISAVAFPWYIYAAWIGIVPAFLVCAQRSAKARAEEADSEKETPRTKYVTILGNAVVLFSGLLLTLYQTDFNSQRLRVYQSRRSAITVIGDSISADMEEGITPWPALLEQRTGIAVTNLARAGATLETARNQAARIPRDTTLVIFLIGGNDMLDGIGARQFDKDLRALIDAIPIMDTKPLLMMVELPLPPFRNLIGRSQRRVAKEHGITLIRRMELASVLAARNATTDGLHLSPRGHQLLTVAIMKYIRILP